MTSFRAVIVYERGTKTLVVDAISGNALLAIPECDVLDPFSPHPGATVFDADIDDAVTWLAELGIAPADDGFGDGGWAEDPPLVDGRRVFGGYLLNAVNEHAEVSEYVDVFAALREALKNA